jgi:hypothetical protein
MAVQVDVGSTLPGLRGLSQLTSLSIYHQSQDSRHSSSAVPPSVPADFLALALPRLQRLKLPMTPACLDLQACPLLHTFEVTDAFDFDTTTGSPPVGGIFGTLRNLSRMFLMPKEVGQWASVKGYCGRKDAHWHGGSSKRRCYSCSPVYTIQVGRCSV